MWLEWKQNIFICSFNQEDMYTIRGEEAMCKKLQGKLRNNWCFMIKSLIYRLMMNYNSDKYMHATKLRYIRKQVNILSLSSKRLRCGYKFSSDNVWASQDFLLTGEKVYPMYLNIARVDRPEISERLKKPKQK